MRHVKEIAAGAGVGIGVLGQEKEEPEDNGEEGENQSSPDNGEEKEKSTTINKESVISNRKKIKTTMKIKTRELQEMVKSVVNKKLLELMDRDSVPGKDGELGKYAEKLDKFLDDSIEEINELITEAEKMMRENLLNHPTIGERNRALMSRVGVLKNLKAKLLEILEATHRTI